MLADFHLARPVLSGFLESRLPPGVASPGARTRLRVGIRRLFSPLSLSLSLSGVAFLARDFEFGRYVEERLKYRMNM